MDLSPDLIEAVKRFEGFSPTAQWDYKQNSNGYGTKAQSPGETIDQDTADARLRAELGKAQTFVQSVAPDAPPGVQRALTSLTYNTGTQWAGAGLGKAIQSGDYDTAKNLFLQYNKAGGAFNQGLADRRTQEAAWFGGDQPQQTAQAAPQTAPQQPQGILAQAQPQAPQPSGGILGGPMDSATENAATTGTPNTGGIFGGQQQPQQPQMPAPQRLRMPIPPGLAHLASLINPYG